MHLNHLLTKDMLMRKPELVTGAIEVIRWQPGVEVVGSGVSIGHVDGGRTIDATGVVSAVGVVGVVRFAGFLLLEQNGCVFDQGT